MSVPRRASRPALLALSLIFLGACAADAGAAGREAADDPASTAGFNSSLDYAQVEFVEAVLQSYGESGQPPRWRFSVRVRHNDQGWDHYADEWQVIDDETEEVYGVRVLAHPHDTEQPFTRSQSGIEIPGDVRYVRVRARCNVHGYGGREVRIDLEGREGDRYSVVRSR